MKEMIDSFVSQLEKEINKQKQNVSIPKEKEPKSKISSLQEKLHKKRVINAYFKQKIDEIKKELKETLSDDKSIDEMFQFLEKEQVQQEIEQPKVQEQGKEQGKETQMSEVEISGALGKIEKLDDKEIGFLMPYNPQSGKSYKGINSVKLLKEMMSKGEKDARFLTMVQAQKIGATLKPDAKALKIEFNQNGVLKTANVYHASDFNNLEAEKEIHFEKNAKEILGDAILSINKPKEQVQEQEKTQKIYFNISKENKEEAKKLGARWDKDKKSWYANANDTKSVQALANFANKSRTQTQTQARTARTQTKTNNNAQEKTYLNIAYKDRFEAKKLGAKWDKEQKSWYASKQNVARLAQKFEVNMQLTNKVAKQPKQQQQQRAM